MIKNGLLLHLKRAVLSKINYINDGLLLEAMKMNLNINSIAKFLDKLLYKRKNLTIKTCSMPKLIQ
jgi:hypothetical protein